VKAVVVLLLLAGAVAVVAKLRYDAKRDRHEVLARLSDETSTIGVVSPTEALFREEGVPVTDELLRSLAGTQPESEVKPNPLQAAVGVLQRVRLAPAEGVAGGAPTVGVATNVPAVANPPTTTDLSDLCAGIELPCGLTPLAMTGGLGVECAVATFSTSADVRQHLASDLADELARVGCAVRWVDGATAVVRRDDATALVTIYDRPDEHLDRDGTPRFGALPPGRVVVQLTAV